VRIVEAGKELQLSAEGILPRLKLVFDILNAHYNKAGRFEDDKALAQVNSWSGLEEGDRKIPDYYFTLNLCYGPWVEERQKNVWTTVYRKFKESCKGDLRNLTNSMDLGFPFDWQDQHAKRLAQHLRAKGMSFSDLFKTLDKKSGLEARNELADIMRTSTTKTLSTLLRDLLSKDVFPIDTRVQKILSYLGLPIDEDAIVIFCKKVGINPRTLNRMMYKHGERCNSNLHSDCPLAAMCYIPLYLRLIFEVKP